MHIKIQDFINIFLPHKMIFKKLSNSGKGVCNVSTRMGDCRDMSFLIGALVYRCIPGAGNHARGESLSSRINTNSQ